jgi:cytochrome c biogenesis protein CcmG/thiol:disulfide interchange protein DsbE
MRSVSMRIWFLLLFLLIINPALSFSQERSVLDLPLKTIEGTAITIGEKLQNGPVLLSFWASWCEPCRQELHALKNVIARNKDWKCTILAVNQDSPRSLAKVKAFTRSLDIPAVFVLDPNNELFRRLQGTGIPFSVLIDTSGNVVSKHVGYLPGDELKIEKEILKWLQ